MKTTPSVITPELKELLSVIILKQAMLFKHVGEIESKLSAKDRDNLDELNCYSDIAQFLGIPLEQLDIDKDDECPHGKDGYCLDWLLNGLAEVKDINDSKNFVQEMIDEGCYQDFDLCEICQAGKK